MHIPVARRHAQSIVSHAIGIVVVEPAAGLIGLDDRVRNLDPAAVCDGPGDHRATLQQFDLLEIDRLRADLGQLIGWAGIAGVIYLVQPDRNLVVAGHHRHAEGAVSAQVAEVVAVIRIVPYVDICREVGS